MSKKLLRRHYYVRLAPLILMCIPFFKPGYCLGQELQNLKERINVAALRSTTVAAKTASKATVTDSTAIRTAKGKPVVNSFTPASAPTGSTITISGGNFDASVKVAIGG